jgi:hypothetical protein
MPNETKTPTTEFSLPAVFNPRDEFELALRQAKVYAASTIVPKDYQDNLPNCLVALNMAKRIGADPLQVLQNLYIVHGRPGWSAQFLIATFNQCGKFSALRYEWTGTEGTDTWGCRAYATEKATGERITGPLITIALSKKEGWYQKSGSKWQTIPQLMLTYRAAAWLVRTHAPELAMGIQTEEELRDVIDITPIAGEKIEKTDAITTAKADVKKALEGTPAEQTDATTVDPATGELNLQAAGPA